MIRTSVFALSCAMGLTSAAYGQIWVSQAVGSDSNACTRSAPCKTFAHAISVTPAWGQVSVLDPGDYGPAYITQPITIDGGGMASNVVTSGGTGFSVQAPSGAVVQLRNMAVHGNGGTYGIAYNTGSQLVIENMKVNGFGGDCVHIGANGGGDADIVIKDTSIDNCSGNGIGNYTGSTYTGVTIEMINSQVRYANTAIYSNTGVVAITDSALSSPGNNGGSGVTGLNVQGGYAVLDKVKINNFNVGVSIYNATAQLSNCTLTNNFTGVATAGSGSFISNGNNVMAGNGVNGTPNRTLGTI